MERSHCWQALSYIEQNPVRGAHAVKAREYLYSSARVHETYPEDVDMNESLLMREWRKFYSPQEWAGVLDTSVSGEALARRLKEATSKGIPSGLLAFTQHPEELLGRDLSNRGPGVPKKLPGPWAIAAE